MFYKPSRLFIIKFLGLWGGHNLDSKSNGHTNRDVNVPAAENYDKLCNNEIKLASNQTSLDSAIDSSRRKVIDLLLEKGAPGLTICVSKNNKIVWRAAFGICDVENQLACDVDAAMRIGSISKSIFVSAIVGPMLDKGNLDFNSSIHNHLSTDEFPKKDFQGRDSDITIGQLLTHTSGITHYKDSYLKDCLPRPLGSKDSKKAYQCDDQFYRIGKFQRETFRDVVEALKPFKDEPLVSEPGKYHYTTYGYVLLSAVMQKIHQSKVESKNEQIQDFWIKVLRNDWRMENTFLDEDETIIPNRSKYYMRTGLNGALINAPYSDNSNKWAGGGLVSTTDDLVKFANTLINCYKGKSTQPLKSESVNSLWERKNPHYALGFQRLDSKNNWRENEKFIVHHTGSSCGASSILMIYPESEVVVAILINLSSVNLKPLAILVADYFENSQTVEDKL